MTYVAAYLLGCAVALGYLLESSGGKPSDTNHTAACSLMAAVWPFSLVVVLTMKAVSLLAKK